MADIRLGAGERGLLLGTTGSGKSTLATWLIDAFRRQYPTGRVLVLDSKPRYRGEYHPSGVRVRYSGWVDGDSLADSVVVADERVSLSAAYQHGSAVLFQAFSSGTGLVPDYRQRAAAYCTELFRYARKTRPCLLYVDEFYDLLSGPAGYADPRILHAVRSGRERNLAVLAAAQRPRSIPLPILTESQNWYIFFLEYEDDLTYLKKHGPPAQGLRPHGHEFLFSRSVRGGRRESYLARLDLGREAVPA